MRPRPSSLRRIAAGLTVALVVAGCSAAGGATKSAPSIGTAGSRVVPARIGDLSLVDDHGATVTLASLRGKTVVLTDFLTLCQEICPLVSSNLLQVETAVNRAGLGNDVVLVQATVDPPRDTPARLAAYRKLIGAGPDMMFLTGDALPIGQLWNWFGVAYEVTAEDSPAPIDWMTGKPLTYDVGHSDAIFFIDPHGVQRYVIGGPPSASSAAMPSGLASFLSDQGRANLASHAADSWTAADVDAVLSWLTGKPVRP